MSYHSGCFFIIQLPTDLTCVIYTSFCHYFFYSLPVAALDLSAKKELENTNSGGFKLDPEHNIHPLSGDFSGNPHAERFVDNMVKTHGFDRQQLQDVLAQTKRLDYVLNLMEKQAPAPKTTTTQAPSMPVPNGSYPLSEQVHHCR